MKVRGLVCSLLGGALLACGSTPSVIPARNLERPTDMGMVCLAVDSTTGQLSGQPMGVCHPTRKADPVFSSSPRKHGTFALVTNTARGELAVVDLDMGRLIDLDPVVFGFNMVQVGAMPENLAASPDGCWIATANRVSCDIGLVDPSLLLSSLFTGVTPSTAPNTETGTAGNPVLQRVTPQSGSGRKLQLAPKEIVFLLPDRAPGVCQPNQSSLALVSFPSCDLVALMDLPSGIIKDSVYVRGDVTVPAGAEPICPVDYCVDAENPVPGDDAGAAGEVDAGVGDAGNAGAKGNLGVGALALRPDRSTVYVGASRGDGFLAVLNVVDGKLVDGGHIPLESGALGINHLRLSVDPWQPPPALDPENETPEMQAIREMRGSFIGTRGEFLYAFAQDGSVRVVDVTSQPGRECDVNARPELAGPVTTSCFPVNPQARQPLARGPGIRIPTLPVRNAAPPIPRDISVLDLRVADPAQIEKNPQALAGQFAFLLASDNSVYVLNLSPHDTGAPEDPVMTHSFREARASGQSAPDLLMLVSAPPLRTTVTTDLLYATTPLISSASGPRLEKVTTTITPAVPISSNYITSDYYADFPNQSREVSRIISIVWEDTIPNTARKSGKLSPPSAAAPAGTLVDRGANFCGKGVLKGDLVVLPGCTDDTDCSPQELYSCRQPISGSAGLCLPLDASQGLLEKCTRFSGSRRRYEILDARSDSLSLGLHLDEVPKTALNRWNLADTKAEHTDAECQPTESHKASGTRLGFSWQQVWQNEAFKRCVEPCAYPRKSPSDFDRDCRPGFVCEVLPGSTPAQVQVGDQIETAAGYCVEAPPLDSECWPQPGNAYQVNAGNSFWVSGTSLPDLPSTKLDPQGSCQADPNDPLLVNRIPLSAPECTTIAGTAPISSIDPNQPGNAIPSNTELALFGPDAPTSKTPQPPYSPVSAPGPNPCLYQDINRDEGLSATATPRQAIKAIFQNPEVRFVLTNLDQYAGDGLVTRLTLRGGFFPLRVDVPNYDVALTQPIRIFTGPTKLPDSPSVVNPDPNDRNPLFYRYMYVLDQGRTALTPGSRGQIIRINARKGSDAQVVVDPSSSGTQPFQIQ